MLVFNRSLGFVKQFPPALEHSDAYVIIFSAGLADGIETTDFLQRGLADGHVRRRKHRLNHR